MAIATGAGVYAREVAVFCVKLSDTSTLLATFWNSAKGRRRQKAKSLKHASGVDTEIF